MNDLTNLEENKWLIFNKERRICDISCPFFAICPMTVYAPHASCSDLAVEDRKRFFHLFLFGAEGLKNEILSSLYTFSRKISFVEPKDVRDYLELLIKVHKSVYDGKNITKNSGTFNILVGDYKANEEKPRKSEPILILDSQKDPEKDPESLIFSDLVASLVKDIRKTSRPSKEE